MKISRWMAGLFAGVAIAGTVQAAIFQGRDASGAVDNTCTATGATKCAMFYDTTLNITILNNWNIGPATWSADQALVEAAGLAVSGLSGWVLPTGFVFVYPAAFDPGQYLLIWQEVGSTLSGLQSQFDGVQASFYWSSTELNPGVDAWAFDTTFGLMSDGYEDSPIYAVAVRPGDVAYSVPEPPSLALVLLALGAGLVAGHLSKKAPRERPVL